MNYLLFATLTVLVGCQLGCRTEAEPCSREISRDLSQDEMLDVTVVGPALSEVTPSFYSDLPSCSLDDVQIGDSLPLTLSKRIEMSSGGGGSCYEFECPLDFPGPATAVERSAIIPALSYVCRNATSKVQLAADCEVGRFVGLYGYGEPGLYATEAGTAPTHVLIRALTRSATGAVCNDMDQRYPRAKPGQESLLCVDMFSVTFTKR